MGQDNPFSDEKTVIRPNPGGRRPAAGAPPSAPPMGGGSPPFLGDGSTGAGPFGVAAARPDDTAPVADATVGGLNPLAAAAAPILALAVRLRSMAALPDVEGLRERVAREIRLFQHRASAAGVQQEALHAGHYALCATVDDVISNTPWGAGTWSRQTMTGTFHNDVSGGERFFDFLGRLQKEPGRYIDVLELMYLCLSLGFEGRYRLVARGASELARVREGIYVTIRQVRGEFERELSPRWRGVEAPHRVLTSFLPGWVVGVAAAAAIVLTFIGYSTLLNGASDEVYAGMSTLPPIGKAVIRTAAAAPPPPVLPRGDTLQKLRTFLAPEIKQGLVTLSETGRTVTIRLTATNMFDSGSASLKDAVRPLIDRIGTALDTEPGSVLVAGHTDNVPIRSVRFPSNFHLSAARAEAVADLIKKSIKAPPRVTAEGHADSEPLVANDTAEHRAANRRIEVVLTKQEPAR